MATDPTSPAFLGFGLLTPFQRDAKNDFANGGGDELLKAAVRQVLGTRGRIADEPGELPWRDDFGSVLDLLRQRNVDGMWKELARHYVQDALARWDARVVVASVDPVVDPLTQRAVEMRVKFVRAGQNTPGVNVDTSALEVAVPLV